MFVLKKDNETVSSNSNLFFYSLHDKPNLTWQHPCKASLKYWNRDYIWSVWGFFYEEGIRIFTFHLCFRITLLTKSVWTVFRCFSMLVRLLHSNAKHINSWQKCFVSKEHQDTFCPVIKLNLLLDLFIRAGAIFWLTVLWWCICAMPRQSKMLWWCITRKMGGAGLV